MDFLISKITRQKIDKLIQEYQTDAKTLEIGSFGAPRYARFFPNKIGIDIRAGQGVDIVASVYNLPFKDEEFDVVLCMSVIEHLEEPKTAIKEMHRVLKNGGKIIVSVPFMFPINDAPNDYWRLTKYGLKYLFRDGWGIEKLVAENDIQETFAVLLQRVCYQTKMKLNKPMKLVIFSLARIIERMPNMIKQAYGDISKKIKEPEAFTNAYFLVAKKVQK